MMLITTNLLNYMADDVRPPKPQHLCTDSEGHYYYCLVCCSAHRYAVIPLTQCSVLCYYRTHFIAAAAYMF